MDVRALTLQTLTDLLRAELGENPGAGEHVIRCKPGTARFRGLTASVKRRTPVEVPNVIGNGTLENRAQGEVENREKTGSFIVEGTASSTSVDWYGTEMSQLALIGMSEQFQKGVDLFPRHGGWLDTVEWDEVVGRTFSAKISRAEVADGAEGEDGFILEIQARVERSAPRAEELERRLDDEQQIGLSIGGWFLEVRYITDEDGDITRIIIESVLLDHVAIVRSPANPDSDDLKMLREAGHAAVRSIAPQETASEIIGDLQNRHVMSVDVEEDAIVLRIAKAGEEADESGDDEDGDEGRSTGNLPEVTPDPPVDNDYPGGEGSQTATGDDPANRSEIDMDKDKLDLILASLEAAKEERAANAARLEALEARGTETPAPVEAVSADVEIVAPTAEEQAAVMARAIADALEARNIGGTPAVAPAAVEDEVSPEMKEMRAKVELLETQNENRERALANLVGSGRVGVGTRMAHPILGGGYDDEGAKADIEGLIARCKDNGDTAPVLCAIVNRNKASLAICREPSGSYPVGTRGAEVLRAAHNAPSTLRSLLIAAERDGLIGDLDKGWA